MKAAAVEKMREALKRAQTLEDPMHADFCEGCATCDVFDTIDDALGLPVGHPDEWFGAEREP